MAVYLVNSSSLPAPVLVEARTAKSAINHVVGESFTAEVVKTKDLVKFVNEGHKIQTIDEAAEKEAA